MQRVEKYGVSCASWKYNKTVTYLFLEDCWDGTVGSLARLSRFPRSHPSQHMEAELKLIRDMRRCNPELGMVER